MKDTRTRRKIKKPQVLVLCGFGINCEEETAYAFNYVGAEATVRHINDVCAHPSLLEKVHIIAFPGGFSFGDHMGSGKAYAHIVSSGLKNELDAFIARGGLVIGICNGFQIISALGLVPGVLLHNTGARYLTRWVDVAFSNTSPWTKGLGTVALPIAHGEGRYMIDTKGMQALKKSGGIAGEYVSGEMCHEYSLPANPNGALKNIAGVTAHGGRVFGLMPHPERALFFTQLPNWTNKKDALKRKNKKIPTEGPGVKVFRNAVEYCKKNF